MQSALPIVAALLLTPLVDGRYRYTWYGGRADSAEELYDHATDPLEHQNLAANPGDKEILARFKKHLPTHDEPDSPRNELAGAAKKVRAANRTTMNSFGPADGQGFRE